jgi:hypothetical protein
MGQHGYVFEYSASLIIFILTGMSVLYDVLTLLWYKKRFNKIVWEKKK